MEKNENPTAPAPPSSARTDSALDLKAKNMDDLLTRARQTVKPIISREAAGEVVSDDVLNFRMKAST
jgi:hypothetical protein